MPTKPFEDLQVATHFDCYPAAVKKRMLALREPAYLTSQTRSGSTLRLDWKPKHPQQLAMYFNCQTTLVATFRSLFPNDFQYEGNRALLLNLSGPLPKKELSICITATLTYHLKKKR